MCRVLIADDEPIEMTIISKMIQKNYGDQLEIVQAVNGREAITLFHEKECKIAILDIEMPGVNGLKAAEEIRKTNQECSIIFLTAFEDFSYARKAILVRALDYLLKPAAEDEVVAVLDEAIRLLNEGESKEVREDDWMKEQLLDETVSMETIRVSTSQRIILEFIQQHFQEDISLQDVARTMNYSDAYFCKLFKQCFDKNFTAYLSEFRVARAKQLLEDMAINVREISELVGYRDSNYFAKVFKRIAGITPSEYRLMLQKKHIV